MSYSMLSSHAIQMEASMQKSGLTWFSLLTVLPFLASHRERGPDPLALVNDYAQRANAHDIPVELLREWQAGR